MLVGWDSNETTGPTMMLYMERESKFLTPQGVHGNTMSFAGPGEGRCKRGQEKKGKQRKKKDARSQQLKGGFQIRRGREISMEDRRGEMSENEGLTLIVC